MLKVKPFRQKTGLCGPASLKMILGYFGIIKSENELSRLTNCTQEWGVEAEVLIRVAKSMGFQGEIHDNARFNDIKTWVHKRKIPIIVDWFSPEEAGHYSVVVGFDKDKIILADPHFGELKKHKIEWFKERWFDIVNDKLILREIIVIQ